MQIRTGKIFITSGTALARGNAEVNWIQVIPKNLLIIAGAVYEIASVDAGAKEIVLTSPYVGTTYEVGGAGVDYVIVTDFTSTFNLPLLNDGDLEAAAIIRRLTSTLDRILVGGGGVEGSPSAVFELTVALLGAHGFVVGNALQFAAGVWALASSGTPEQSQVIGLVSEVVDANTFRLRVTGHIGSSGTPPQPIPYWDGAVAVLVPGHVYYIRATPIAVTGGLCNIVDGTVSMAQVGTTKVPLMVADSTSSGYLLTLAAAQSGQFASDTPGIVPGPTPTQITNNDYLRAQGWGPSALADGSIKLRHLHNNPATFDGDWGPFIAATPVAETELYLHIKNLHERLAVLETGSNFTAKFYSRNYGCDPGPSVKYAYWQPDPGVTGAYWSVMKQRLNERTQMTLYTPISPGEKFKIWLPGEIELLQISGSQQSGGPTAYYASRPYVLILKELADTTLVNMIQSPMPESKQHAKDFLFGGHADANLLIENYSLGAGYDSLSHVTFRDTTNRQLAPFINEAAGVAYSYVQGPSPILGMPLIQPRGSSYYYDWVQRFAPKSQTHWFTDSAGLGSETAYGGAFGTEAAYVAPTLLPYHGIRPSTDNSLPWISHIFGIAVAWQP